MRTAGKVSPAEQRWLDAQRTKWVPLSERQALVIRNALRSADASTEESAA
ncbi:hypothetical protein [Nocardia sp. MH4]|nr:hypothetical protein [Nocardia sp. MH4]